VRNDLISLAPRIIPQPVNGERRDPPGTILPVQFVRKWETALANGCVTTYTAFTALDYRKIQGSARSISAEKAASSAKASVASSDIVETRTR
jgi:hypothetical protein